jgi:hypothetical protein
MLTTLPTRGALTAAAACVLRTSASAFFLLRCSRVSAERKISMAALRSDTSCAALASFCLPAGSVVSAHRVALDRARRPQRAAGLVVAASSPMIAHACENSSNVESSTASAVNAVPAAGSSGTGVPAQTELRSTRGCSARCARQRRLACRTCASWAEHKGDEVVEHTECLWVALLIVHCIEKGYKCVPWHVTVHADPSEKRLKDLLVLLTQCGHLLHQPHDDAELGLHRTMSVRRSAWPQRSRRAE